MNLNNKIINKNESIETKKAFVNAIFIFSLVVTGIIIGILVTKVSEEQLYIPLDKFDAILSICDNRTLQGTAYCLRDDVYLFYNYNISNAGKVLTDEQLRSQGGVCSSYASFYKDKGTKLGYDVVTPIFMTGQNTSHQIAIMSDETGYCLLDQLELYCVGLETGENENQN